MEATRTDTKKNEMKYEKSELELMTTYQLREICRREKIMNGVIHPLDKEELIQKDQNCDKALQRIILPVPDFSL